MVDSVSHQQGQAQQTATPAGIAAMRRVLREDSKTSRPLTDQAPERTKKTAAQQSTRKRRGGNLDVLA